MLDCENRLPVKADQARLSVGRCPNSQASSSFLSVLRTPHIDLFSASLSIGPRRVQRSSGLLQLKWWPSPSSTFGRGSFHGTSHRPAIDPARRDVQVVSDLSSPFLLAQVRGLFPLLQQPLLLSLVSTGGASRRGNRPSPTTVERRDRHVLIEQPHDQLSVFHTDYDENLPFCTLAVKPICPRLRGSRCGLGQGSLG